MPNVDFPLPDLTATHDMAQYIAPLLKQSDMLTLHGDLGVGKTEFVRAVLHTLGVIGDVPSPTFTLVQTYDVGGVPFSHFDLYRLKSPDELDELGWDDARAEGVVCVEWPERAGGRLPADRLDMFFNINPDGVRHCVLAPHGTWKNRLL